MARAAKKPQGQEAGGRPAAEAQSRSGDPLAGAFLRTNIANVNYGFLTKTLGYAIRQAQIPIYDWHFAHLNREFHGGKMAALVIIGSNDGLRQRDLAQILGVAHSAIVGLIDRFAQMGLVERMTVPQDRRAYELALTDAGREKVAEFEEIARIHDQQLSALMTPAERKTLLGLLDRIAKSGSDTPQLPTVAKAANRHARDVKHRT